MPASNSTIVSIINQQFSISFNPPVNFWIKFNVYDNEFFIWVKDVLACLSFYSKELKSFFGVPSKLVTKFPIYVLLSW